MTCSREQSSGRQSIDSTGVSCLSERSMLVEAGWANVNLPPPCPPMASILTEFSAREHSPNPCTCFGVKCQLVSPCQLHWLCLSPHLWDTWSFQAQLLFCLWLFAMGPKASSKRRKPSGFGVEPGGPSLAIRPSPDPVGIRRSTPPPSWASERPQRACLSEASVVSLIGAWKELPPSPTQKTRLLLLGQLSPSCPFLKWSFPPLLLEMRCPRFCAWVDLPAS